MSGSKRSAQRAERAKMGGRALPDRDPKCGAIWENVKRFPTTLKRSIFRHGVPASDHERALAMTSNLFLHTHAVQVRRRSLMPSQTLGLGVIALVLFLILVITGVLLMMFYVPDTREAYDRIRDLSYVVPGGQLMRNVHRWAAHGMVIVVLLHMARVFYMAAYRADRELNWVIGILLLVLTFALSFTGYLLPWDQLAFWAITVGSNIASSPRELTDALALTAHVDPGGTIRHLLLGGEQVGQDALLRFYVLHCVVLPLGAGLLIGLHLWRVRKSGGLAHPSEDQQDDRVMSWPNLILTETSLFLVVSALMIILGVLFDAPLRELANPALPENPAKAPWYFLGLQELVSYSAFCGGIIVPLLALGGLALIPYLDRETEGTGRWLCGRRSERRLLLGTTLFATLFFLLLLAFTVRFGWLRDWSPDVPELVVIFFNPGAVIALFAVIVSLLVARRTNSTRMAALFLFSTFLVGFLILTVMGTYFRGPNWDFFWSPSQWPGH